MGWWCFLVKCKEGNENEQFVKCVCVGEIYLGSGRHRDFIGKRRLSTP